MKVVCIKECRGNDLVAKFKVGDIVTMLEVPQRLHLTLIMECRTNPKDCCIIEEDPCDDYGNECIWLKSHFAPISEIDETEMERNYQRVDQSLYKNVTH